MMLKAGSIRCPRNLATQGGLRVAATCLVLLASLGQASAGEQSSERVSCLVPGGEREEPVPGMATATPTPPGVVLDVIAMMGGVSVRRPDTLDGLMTVSFDRTPWQECLRVVAHVVGLEISCDDAEIVLSESEGADVASPQAAQRVETFNNLRSVMTRLHDHRARVRAYPVCLPPARLDELQERGYAAWTRGPESVDGWGRAFWYWSDGEQMLLWSAGADGETRASMAPRSLRRLMSGSDDLAGSERGYVLQDGSTCWKDFAAPAGSADVTETNP